MNEVCLAKTDRTSMGLTIIISGNTLNIDTKQNPFSLMINMRRLLQAANLTAISYRWSQFGEYLFTFFSENMVFKGYLLNRKFGYGSVKKAAC